MAELYHFKVQESDDGAKRDHELHCDMCGDHLCDIQHDDTLDVLVAVADNHVCKDPKLTTREELEADEWDPARKPHGA